VQAVENEGGWKQYGAMSMPSHVCFGFEKT